MAPRGTFSSRIGFIAVAAGSAVGLGNIWRFPYETGENGGAAFLLIYLVCMVLIGFPVMVSEITIGRNAQLNPYGSYAKLGGKKWGLLGLWGILCAVMFLSVYNVVAGWAFGYFLKISFGDLLAVSDFGAYFGAHTSSITANFMFSLGFMAITAFIVAKGVQGGIEAAAKILMPILFTLLIGLIIYSLTLDNAWEGVKYYLIPDFSAVSIKTIYDALGQAFFSLSLGMGALITFGSYLSKKDNIAKSAALVTLADTSVAFLAGLLIFPLVFSQGQSPSAGPGLIFVALPGIFQEMGPIAGRVIGGSFFLLLCFAALTSTISLLEIPVGFAVDQKKWGRKKVTAIFAIIIFIIGLPSMLSQGAVGWLTEFMYFEGKTQAFFDMVFAVFSDVGLPLGGFLMSVFISRRWKMSNFNEEVATGNPHYNGSFLSKFLNFAITIFVPIFLGIMFVATVLQKFFGVAIFG